MAETTLPSEELEAAPEGQEDQQEIDPVEARFAKLEGRLGSMEDTHRRVEHQVGYFGRQVERLVNQPQTPARDERIDTLLQQFQEMRLNAIEDPEEKLKFVQRLQEEEATKVKTAPAPKLPEPIERTDPEASTIRDWNTFVGPRLKRHAQQRGVDYEAAARQFPPRLDPYITREDPSGWTGWEAAAEKVIDDHEDAAHKAAQARTRTDTTRGGSPNRRLRTADVASIDLTKGPKALAKETAAMLDQFFPRT